MNLFCLGGVPTRDRPSWRSLARLSGMHLVVLALLLAMLAYAPRAIADDIDPDADVPDSSTLADPSASEQVLEIPQQCDQDAVASLCDRSADGSMSSDTDPALANNPDPGSVYDYANQNITNEASAAGTTNVPIGVYLPGYAAGYTRMSPSPSVVSSGPGGYQQWATGPGSYQQWASGPGTYQQMAPGPGYIQPAPLGYHPYGLGGGYGSSSLGGGGSHFGRR